MGDKTKIKPIINNAEYLRELERLDASWLEELSESECKRLRLMTAEELIENDHYIPGFYGPDTPVLPPECRNPVPPQTTEPEGSEFVCEPDPAQQLREAVQGSETSQAPLTRSPIARLDPGTEPTRTADATKISQDVATPKKPNPPQEEKPSLLARIKEIVLGK